LSRSRRCGDELATDFAVRGYTGERIVGADLVDSAVEDDGIEASVGEPAVLV
jgi:hypothetical protein